MHCRRFLLIIFNVFVFTVNLLLANMDSVTLPNKKQHPSHSKAQQLFTAGFLEARLQHIEALKHIQRTMNYEKQHKLTYQVFLKLFDILKTSKAALEDSNYIPGFDFPNNQTVIEALGQLLDNTALYGEFQLRMPDITDRIMKGHNEWMVLVKWAIPFSNSTGLYDPKTSVMLNLVCQEMNLIERSENFVNPYRKPAPEVPSSHQKKDTHQKKKKEFKKGPRMSRPHIEL